MLGVYACGWVVFTIDVMWKFDKSWRMEWNVGKWAGGVFGLADSRGSAGGQERGRKLGGPHNPSAREQPRGGSCVDPEAPIRVNRPLSNTAVKTGDQCGVQQTVAPEETISRTRGGGCSELETSMRSEVREEKRDKKRGGEKRKRHRPRDRMVRGEFADAMQVSSMAHGEIDDP